MENFNIRKIEASVDRVKITIEIPYTLKHNTDGLTYVHIPALNIETYGVGNKDVQTAIEESIRCLALVIDKDLTKQQYES